MFHFMPALDFWCIHGDWNGKTGKRRVLAKLYSEYYALYICDAVGFSITNRSGFCSSFSSFFVSDSSAHISTIIIASVRISCAATSSKVSTRCWSYLMECFKLENGPSESSPFPHQKPRHFRGLLLLLGRVSIFVTSRIEFVNEGLSLPIA